MGLDKTVGLAAAASDVTRTSPRHPTPSLPTSWYPQSLGTPPFSLPTPELFRTRVIK